MAARKKLKRASGSKRGPGVPSAYKPEYAAMLLAHMQEGLSFEAFGGVVSKSKETLYQWVTKYPEFADAQSRGETAAALFYEKLGITAMAGRIKNFNAIVWIFTMRNRLRWRNDPQLDDPKKENNSVMQEALDRLNELEGRSRPKPEDQAVIPVESRRIEPETRNEGDDEE